MPQQACREGDNWQNLIHFFCNGGSVEMIPSVRLGTMSLSLPEESYCWPGYPFFNEKQMTGI